MKKSQLSDKQLEEILGHMPKVKDNRDPRDIYQQIVHRVEKRRTMPTWALPSIAAAAVLFLTLILSQGLMDGNLSADKDSKQDSAEDAKVSMNEDEGAKGIVQANQKLSMDESSLQLDQSDTTKNVSEFRAMSISNPYADLTALYEPERQQGQEIFTYAVPDENAQILIPVSISIPAGDSKTWFENYMEGMEQLKEEEWDLSEFYPFEGSLSFSESTNELLVKVEKNHHYQDGATTGPLFLQAVDLNFAGHGIDSIRFETLGETGIDFGHGKIVKTKKIVKKQKRAFLIYHSKRNFPYIVPTREDFSKIEDAFEKMRYGNKYDQTKASIPASWDIETSEMNDEILVIKLKSKELLTEESLINIEAILLTAKDFGYKEVKIVNDRTEHLGPFDLNSPIQVPLAPNKKDIK